MFPTEPVPEKIGPYQVVKCIGRTGAADIYLARAEGPLGFARSVTLKMVRYALDDDARFAEELAREAAICARLNHPGVVRMFDFFEHERRLVLVLEQVEGASLDRLLAHLARRKQRLGDGAVFYLGGQLAAALAHAHASTDEDGNISPVIHRDIKPENVLIGWDGQARLSGFGLGKILGRTPDSIAGTVKGTPGFMSPEQARGERATVRSDVYGFGVLLWSLLGGKEPPTDGTRLQPIGELRQDLPRELVAAIDAALEPSPDRRRISCADLAQWLAKLVRPDAGREELRQKVLWLRATRGPTSRVDVPKQAPPVSCDRLGSGSLKRWAWRGFAISTGVPRWCADRSATTASPTTSTAKTQARRDHGRSTCCPSSSRSRTGRRSSAVSRNARACSRRSWPMPMDPRHCCVRRCCRRPWCLAIPVTSGR